MPFRASRASGSVVDSCVALVNHALKNPSFVYTIESHRNSHNVTYETARTDLLGLANLGVVDQGKRGRKFVFTARRDLRRRIEKLPPAVKSKA